MRNKKLFLVALLVIFALPVQAIKPVRVQRAVSKARSVVFGSALANRAAVARLHDFASRAAQMREINTAFLKNAFRYRKKVFEVQIATDGRHTASAFALNIQGRVWGVTAAHVMHNISSNPFIKIKKGTETILAPIPSWHIGNKIGNDVAIFEIPQEILPHIEVLSPSKQALLPATHEATGEMLNAVGYVDLCIPRGGRKLIDFVRDTARIPVIETGAGVVNTYFDKDGDLEMGKAIINNAKTRRVSVCNALDCLLVHQDRLGDLYDLVSPMAEKSVIIYADEKAYAALDGKYPLLEHATEESFGTEFMDYKLAIKTVASLDEALDHIDENGSGHSEAIITKSEATARQFQAHVDAACVYWNAPTSFTDGAQFGLGAEIGISTQKLGPRGPMALEEICTYKWLIEGEGQTRP